MVVPFGIPTYIENRLYRTESPRAALRRRAGEVSPALFVSLSPLAPSYGFSTVQTEAQIAPPTLNVAAAF
jgi:hypothetical protein